MGCFKVGSVIIIVTGLGAVVTIYLAEVRPRRLHGDAASNDTSSRLRDRAAEIVGADLRHHPPNVCKVEILPLKVGLADSVAFWWKALQEYVLVSVVRKALFRGDGK